jgi:hypothetical protein
MSLYTCTVTTTTSTSFSFLSYHLLFLPHISSSSLTSPPPLSHLLFLSHISSSSCSQRIYKKYAGDKNVIIVEGDHNSNRPKVLYDQATLFLVHILQVCGVLCCTVLFGYWCALFWIDLVGFLPSTILLLLFLSSPLLAIFRIYLLPRFSFTQSSHSFSSTPLSLCTTTTSPPSYLSPLLFLYPPLLLLLSLSYSLSLSFTLSHSLSLRSPSLSLYLTPLP